MAMTTFIHPDALTKFKEEVKGRRIFLLFYSASLDAIAKVLCVEISLEAFETMIISQKAKSFDADFGWVITIENIKV